MKRIITILLSLVMVVSVLSLFACAGQQDDNKEQEEVDENGVYLDSLPATMDFGGEEINFVFAEGSETFTARSISVEEDDGDSVNAKIIARNEAVQSRLNITIDSYQVEGGIADLKGKISNSLAAGAGDYDIIVGYQYYDIGMATEGWLVNLNNLADYNADYIDFDADYWGKYYNENLQYGDTRFWITGDLALRYIGGMYCTFVNARIYDDILADKYGSIYDIARNGEWTLDKMTTLAALCYRDNGDDKTDEEDQIGYGWEPNDPLDGLAFGSEVPFSTKSSDGTIKITLNSQRTIDFIQKLGKLLESNSSFKYTDSDSDTVMTAFKNGTVAFHVNKVFKAESYLQNMEDQYYMVPCPKFDESQTYYVTGVHDGCSIFGIAWDSPNVPAAAATLEALAAESLRIVTPVYYQSSLKYKYTRDDDSAAMIDLIREHVETDFAAVWSASIKDIAHYFRTNNSTKVSSSNLKRSESAYQEALKDLIKAFNELAEDT